MVGTLAARRAVCSALHPHRDPQAQSVENAAERRQGRIATRRKGSIERLAIEPRRLGQWRYPTQPRLGDMTKRQLESLAVTSRQGLLQIKRRRLRIPQPASRVSRKGRPAAIVVMAQFLSR